VSLCSARNYEPQKYFVLGLYIAQCRISKSFTTYYHNSNYGPVEHVDCVNKK